MTLIVRTRFIMISGINPCSSINYYNLIIKGVDYEIKILRSSITIGLTWIV